VDIARIVRTRLLGFKVMDAAPPRAIVRPRTEGLAPELAAAARHCAEVLRARGERAWLVGGAVRDLALGRTARDVDLACAAGAEVIEDLFPRTHAVGRAFGTVVVQTPGGVDVQITTFRGESNYADGRRPEQVHFGASLERDAERRDFTCNALYLDPLDDTLLDPTGGLVDLAAGRLRCVGEPAQRFAEDGLRPLRLVRFAAEFELRIEPATRAAAGQAGEALRGVSAERVLAELARLCAGPAPGWAVGELAALALLARLPGFARLERATLAARVEALQRLARPDRIELLAVLFRLPGEEPTEPTAALSELRPARAELEGVRRIWGLEPALLLELQPIPPPGRARLLRLLRDEAFGRAWRVHLAWRGAPPPRDLAAERAAFAPAELAPTPLVTSGELARAGVPRGPRWGELLRAAEDAQLEGEVRDEREAALWLARQLAAAPGEARPGGPVG